MNNYFCVMPFFGAEIVPKLGPVTPCCFLKPNSNIKKIKSEMLQQIRPSECSSCWQLEDKGIKSDRQYKNESFDFYSNKDITLIEQDCKQGNYSEQIVKLYTSILCNSTCVTCGPELSSAWASLNKFKNKSISISKNFINQLNYHDLKMLSFVGGEPLYEKKNFQILDTLSRTGNTNCFISIVTNGSVKLNKNQIDILTRFPNLNLCLSIDGIESKFEYIRYPLKWQVLLENLELFRSLNIKLSVSYTISNLNILYYNEIVSWFEKQQLKYNQNMVSEPEWFSVNSLPSQVKNKLPKETQHLLRKHLPQDDDNFAKFITQIQLQDNLKNISINNFMPEVYKMIKENI